MLDKLEWARGAWPFWNASVARDPRVPRHVALLPGQSGVLPVPQLVTISSSDSTWKA